MVQSKFKSYDELPLFRGAKTVAEVLGRVFTSGKQVTSRPSRQARLSVTGAYELLHQEVFPVLKIGLRLVVPKEKSLAWIEEKTGGITPKANHGKIARSRSVRPLTGFWAAPQGLAIGGDLCRRRPPHITD